MPRWMNVSHPRLRSEKFDDDDYYDNNNNYNNNNVMHCYVPAEIVSDDQLVKDKLCFIFQCFRHI